jgi:hypothetical protein
MIIKCPFLDQFLNDMECPYLESGIYCDEIETNPGNSDAWCTSQIEENLNHEN